MYVILGLYPGWVSRLGTIRHSMTHFSKDTVGLASSSVHSCVRTHYDFQDLCALMQNPHLKWVLESSTSYHLDPPL